MFNNICPSISWCTNNEKSEIKILVPNGTPFIAVGDLVDQIEIESVAGPDLLIAGMISKSHDIIIAPKRGHQNISK